MPSVSVGEPWRATDGDWSPPLPSRSMDFVGIVLGAGRSTRLGRPKQTLPFGATPVLGKVVASAEASALTRVVVVLGGAEPEVRAALDPDRAQLVSNDAYGSGCASSLLAGLDA